ncbi:ubiquinol-cytochrome c reductase core subunit 1 [Tilletia horrida]|uniref:Cytochrome b-c1 complex subunit 2, mitochondrial n=1 Tax=Tilletia horrida TaxID=155126 RepID=A0AAN6JK43_9BASI|nr:ubiquinol-cytochrome c reductase core subunit 1 [Tilletia horrida]
MLAAARSSSVRLAAAAGTRTAATSGSSAARRAFTTASADSIQVAAADDGAPVTTVAVALKAGPRYESAPGVAHALKSSFFKSTEKRSALALIREVELYGGVLSSSLSKEHLLLTAEFLRGDEDFFIPLLGEAVSQASFRRHEFNEEVIPQVASEYEQAIGNPLILGFDQLTQTAFRHRGVGASLFTSPIHPVSHAQTVAFARSAIAKNNLVVLGSGIDSGKLANLVSKSFSNVSGSGSVTKSASAYKGGEQRVPFAAPHGVAADKAHFFIGFEGAATGAAPELAVLRAHLGGESSVKWSSGLSPLAQLAAKDPSVQASAFNLTFSDAGIFGAHVSAPSAKLTAAVKSVTAALKEAASKISSEDLKKAIAKAKYDAASSVESRAGSHEAVAGSLLESGKVATLEDTFKALEGVSASSISSAAEKVLKSKPTTVAIGDVNVLPYADEVL